TVKTNQTSVDQNMITHDDNVNFNVRNTRASGGTALTYAWSRYDRVDVAGQIGEGNDHLISLGRRARFRKDDRYKLNTTASYYRRDAIDEKSDEIVAYSSFTAEHRPDLSSYYDINYDHFSTGSFESESYSGQAAVQHQLYESLTSTFNVHA